MDLTREEKEVLCKDFFERLANALSDSYEKIASCNMDISAYLCPKGTTDEVTYSGKPESSFRISDHWNWYSNIRKNPDVKYVQCKNLDLPKPKRRLAEGKASKPVSATCVAIFKDGAYHTIYGERFNRTTKEWEWVDSDPANFIGM